MPDHRMVLDEVQQPVGDVVEEWICKGAYVKSANFGDMDWSSGEALANITLSIRMDYAILNY